MSDILLLLASVFFTSLFLLVVFNYHTRRVIERYILKPSYGVTDPLFSRSMSGILAADFSEGNKIQTLVDGEEIFSTMLEDIRKAQKSINLESFVYSSGLVSRQFIAALQERSRAGVAVHVLLDWMGSSELDQEHYDALREAGVKVVKYRKPHWYTLPRINNRSHRKILVIDGVIGFTGGVGIADQWLHGRDGHAPWRDTHYRLEGPIVAKMQAAFLENWLKSHARVLEGEHYFPELSPKGSVCCQVFTSSADGIEAIRLMYILSIACAKEHIRISNAYFVPDPALVHALVRAHHRGIRVEIIVPGDKTDQRLVREVSRASWKKLLQAGIHIYEYQPTMYHGKLFIVDNTWTSIGSANCNGRSFTLDDEMNINILDENFAKEQIALFMKDKERSKLVEYRQWKKRSIWKKAIGQCGRLLSGQF
jgi:cardiolipin synthase